MFGCMLKDGLAPPTVLEVVVDEEAGSIQGGGAYLLCLFAPGEVSQLEDLTLAGENLLDSLKLKAQGSAATLMTSSINQSQNFYIAPFKANQCRSKCFIY